MTDRELLTELQYALIEPPDGGESWPSLIWTRPEVLDAVNAGLRALARDTHMHVSRVELPIAARTSTLALPADWLATAALVWRDAAGTRTPLGPADPFEGDLALPGWEGLPNLPLGYSDLGGETLTLQLVPAPAQAGVIELLYIAVPTSVGADTLLPTRLNIMRLGFSRLGFVPGPIALPVAEEFASAVKYAALGTLLRKVGRLLDDERAQYCERRYQLATVAADLLLGGFA
jgi:hypothetical protein